MRTKLFSPLMRGAGPDWSANFKWYEDQPGKIETSAGGGMQETHCRYVIHDRHLYRTVPKTFTTNKGAMLLYTSEDQVLREKVTATLHPSTAPVSPTKDIQPSELEHLQRHILQFGTSADDESCLKFTKPSTDDVYLDESTRPGSLPEVYLEDLRFKTKLYTKSSKVSVSRLKPTERAKSSHHTRTPSPASSALIDSLQQEAPSPCQAASRPASVNEKRKLLRPPSATPPQPMPSVEKRKIEIIKDQQKHIDAASRREKLKFADFELVTTIPDHFKVKGLGGNEPKRRAYSSPVYRTKHHEDATYVSGEDTKSLPLFVVTSSPHNRTHKQMGKHAACQDFREGSESSEITDDSDKIDLGDNLHNNLKSVDIEEEQVNHIQSAGRTPTSPGTKPKSERGTTRGHDQKIIRTRQGVSRKDGAGEVEKDGEVREAVARMASGEARDGEETVLEAVERKLEAAAEVLSAKLDCADAEFVSETAERCPSSRQIIIDLPDENKEKPKESFISAELRLDLTQRLDPAEGEGEQETMQEEDATITTSTIDQKSGEEICSTMEDLNGRGQNRILTYPSFLSLSSANSKENAREDETPQTIPPCESDADDTDEDEKRDALLGAKNLVNEIARSKKGRKKRKGGKEGDIKKKGSLVGKSAKSKQQKTGVVPEPGPTVSDGEFRESVPPKSLVAMHKDTIESTSSITKKKGIPAGTRKKRSTKSSDLHVAWDTQPRSETAISDTDEVFSKSPQTMLLGDENEDQTNTGTPRQRKRLDRSHRQQRSEHVEKQNGPTLGGNVLEIESALEERSLTFHDVEEEDEEMMERLRQEEREREQRALDLLERRIAVDDGSLKRLGEKVDIIEKESMVQKDKEAALRQQEMMEELARKEEERKAYEEVMKAQEAEYERHLQNMLKQEEERNRLLLDNMQKEEMQRDLKRKFAMFRQSQNLELRQHVRLTKLKQKFTIPFKYSYFPILKVDYMNIVTSRESPPLSESNSSKNGKTKTTKKVSIKRI